MRDEHQPLPLLFSWFVAAMAIWPLCALLALRSRIVCWLGASLGAVRVPLPALIPHYPFSFPHTVRSVACVQPIILFFTIYFNIFIKAFVRLSAVLSEDGTRMASGL
jgi:hypothetical protein